MLTVTPRDQLEAINRVPLLVFHPPMQVRITWVTLACLSKTIWPSGLRRWLKAPFRKGVGSNPTVVILRMLRVRRNDVCGRPNDARN